MDETALVADLDARFSLMRQEHDRLSSKHAIKRLGPCLALVIQPVTVQANLWGIRLEHCADVPHCDRGEAAPEVMPAAPM